MAKRALKPDWIERWIIDPQAISPGTSMPSGLFKREDNRWVFSGPTPASFKGYDKTTPNCWWSTSFNSLRRNNDELAPRWDAHRPQGEAYCQEHETAGTVNQRTQE